MRSDHVGRRSTSPRRRQSAGLGELKIDDLRQVLFDRLHDRRSSGPPIDPRGDFPSYVWLVDEYQQGSDGLQQRIAHVVNSLVHDLGDTRVWPRNSRVNLLNFIQECRMALVAVDDMIRQETLVVIPGAGPDAHAGLLKCLLRSGQKRDPPFWLHQLTLLGDEYGGLVFRALTEHGLEVATEYLPRCCRSDIAVDEICLLLPALADQFGWDRVRKAIEMERWLLPGTAYQELWETIHLIRGDKLPDDPSILSRKDIPAEAAMWGALLDDPKKLLSDKATLRALGEMGVSEDNILRWMQDRELQ